MRPCDEVVDRLEEALAGALPPELAEHVRGCRQCRRTLDDAASLRAAGGTSAPVKAPRDLVARLKALPRFAPACDAAMEAIGAALDGEIDEAARGRLLAHIHACAGCRSVWEAFATMHEVGAHVRAPQRLRAVLGMPPRQRLAFRSRRPLFDLRLATAAAYLLAAATIVLVSNPATVARASSSTVEKAGVYARAAVENRLSALTRQARETVIVTADWLQRHGARAIERGRELLGLAGENPDTAKNVDTSEQGGKQR